MNIGSTLPRIGAVTAAAGICVAAAATPAGAHVTVTPSTTAAGDYAVLTFSVGHGCEGAPTREIAIALPEQIPAVTPTLNPMWEVKKVMQKLDEPITDAHGSAITERVSRVVYTAKQPLADGYRTTFDLQVQLPEEMVGETLTFGTVQTCTRGETAWTEVPAEGQSVDQLEQPAPALEVTAATGDGHGTTVESTDAGERDGSGEPDAASDGRNGLGLAGLGLGAVGVALGGAALARTRKG